MRGTERFAVRLRRRMTIGEAVSWIKIAAKLCNLNVRGTSKLCAPAQINSPASYPAALGNILQPKLVGAHAPSGSLD